MKATYARDNDYDRYYEHKEKELDKKFSKKSTPRSKALKGDTKKEGFKEIMGAYSKRFPNSEATKKFKNYK